VIVDTTNGVFAQSVSPWKQPSQTTNEKKDDISTILEAQHFNVVETSFDHLLTEKKAAKILSVA
jgi:hypothetical protein